MRKSLFGAALLLAACGGDAKGAAPSEPANVVELLARAEPVVPPFVVQGEARGLLLVWYDEAGSAHAASSREEVPEASRATVRVDALEVPPEQRLDPAFVYVADLRKPGADELYGVRKVQREAFEAALSRSVARAKTSESAASAATSAEVIIYGASWCGACKQAARYFAQKGVAFVEKDIEKEPAARREMMEKAQAQGVQTGGIPVIDVRGTLLGGFNAQRIEQLLASR